VALKIASQIDQSTTYKKDKVTTHFIIVRFNLNVQLNGKFEINLPEQTSQSRGVEALNRVNNMAPIRTKPTDMRKQDINKKAYIQLKSFRCHTSVQKRNTAATVMFLKQRSGYCCKNTSFGKEINRFSHGRPTLLRQVIQSASS
jgi:hypothetical protein